jgi:hypothetical protein
MDELTEREAEQVIDAMSPLDKIRMGIVCTWLYGQLDYMPTNVQVLYTMRRREETGELSTPI